MGKKKGGAFIDKSKAATFRLTPTVDTTPKPIGDPEVVNVVPVTDDELAEREKYGIYYADNYNYMSHLRGRDEVDTFTPISSSNPTFKLPDFQLTDRAILSAPESSVKVPTNILEIRGKEIPLDLSNSARRTDSANIVDDVGELDPEVLEMLHIEDVDDMDGNIDELEDDFLQLAGGVDMPEGRRIFEEYRRNGGVSDSDMDEDDIIEEEDGDVVDERPVHEPGPILKTPLNPDKKELDERFNAFYENMENSDLDDEQEDQDDEEDPEVDEHLLDTFASEYQDEKDRNIFKKPDPVSKDLTLRAYEEQESRTKEQTESIEVEVRSKRPKWDCESITSTYSNLYNHPTIIQEPSKRKSNLTKRNLKQLDEEQMDCDAASVRTNRSVCTVRSRGETTEERKERKKAVKEERRERRSEKKALKVMFKEEKKNADAQRGQIQIRARPIG